MESGTPAIGRTGTPSDSISSPSGSGGAEPGSGPVIQVVDEPNPDPPLGSGFDGASHDSRGLRSDMES